MNVTQALLLYLKGKLPLGIFMDTVRDIESNSEVVDHIKQELENRKVYVVYDEDSIKQICSTREAAEEYISRDVSVSHCNIKERIIDGLKVRKRWQVIPLMNTDEVQCYEEEVYTDCVEDKMVILPSSSGYVYVESYVSKEHAMKLALQAKEEYINEVLRKQRVGDNS